MSSKRAMRRRSCGRKQRFADALAAQAVIGALQRGKGWQGHLQAYRCRFCGGFHFGHSGR